MGPIDGGAAARLYAKTPATSTLFWSRLRTAHMVVELCQGGDALAAV